VALVWWNAPRQMACSVAQDVSTVCEAFDAKTHATPSVGNCAQHAGKVRKRSLEIEICKSLAIDNLGEENRI